MPNNIRVEIAQELAIGITPAYVLIYNNDELVTTIVAEIEQEKGADGKYYPCVKLKEITI
ncbi:MAG: hypothetical protein AAB784_03335 [Patescibacteria group bacterium]